MQGSPQEVVVFREIRTGFSYITTEATRITPTHCRALILSSDHPKADLGCYKLFFLKNYSLADALWWPESNRLELLGATVFSMDTALSKKAKRRKSNWNILEKLGLRKKKEKVDDK